MADEVAERGYAGASLESVIARAGVSKRSFYQHFESREACFMAVLDLGLRRVTNLISTAFEHQRTWQDGMRAGLAALLRFLDSQPQLARVWLVESLTVGPGALKCRERNLALLRELVVSRWPPSEGWRSPPMAAEGAMDSVLGVVQTHLLTTQEGPLIELLGPLMGMVAAPYLDASGVAQEIRRGEELAQQIQAGEHLDISATHLSVPIPALLRNPNALRARQCLRFLACNPDTSNKEVSLGIGVAHQSQTSKLLSALFMNDLVSKRSDGPGKRNYWKLTPRGEAIERALTEFESL